MFPESHELHHCPRLGLQFAEIILLELGQVGLTANPILLKDICHLMQLLLLEQRKPASANLCGNVVGEEEGVDILKMMPHRPFENSFVFYV